MSAWRHWLPIILCFLAGAAHAATELGVVTLADSGATVLRGASWYKIVPGMAVEDSDILAAGEKTQLQVELAAGTVVSFAGPGAVYLTLSKEGPVVLTGTSGAFKAAVKPPGVRLRLPPLDASVAEGVVVIRSGVESAEVFVESGTARLSSAGPPAIARDAKRGEYWHKSSAGLSTQPVAPRSFVESLPRNFLDPLPVLAARLKSKPVPVLDHEVTYAEAEPWLARDRATFEKRFAVRLKDPAFRKAVEPFVARYPSWDRILHPEKYVPKTAPKK